MPVIASDTGGSIRRAERREHRDGKVGRFVRNLFKKPKAPKVPTAADLYSGPQAFSTYRPEAANVQGDQAGLAASQQALRQIQQVALQGRTPQQDQQMAAFLRQGQIASAGARQAALQGAQARGTSSGGAGLAAGLTGASGDANAAANAAAGMATQAEQNRIAAMGQAGDLGLGINQQTYNQAQANAMSADEWNKWATGMQTSATQTAFENANQRYQQRLQQRQNRLSLGLNSAISAISTIGSMRRDRGGGGGGAGGGAGGGGG